jgi:hypothetical protein
MKLRDLKIGDTFENMFGDVETYLGLINGIPKCMNQSEDQGFESYLLI